MDELTTLQLICTDAPHAQKVAQVLRMQQLLSDDSLTDGHIVESETQDNIITVKTNSDALIADLKRASNGMGITTQ